MRRSAASNSSFLVKGFGEVLVGAHELPPCPVEDAVLRGEHGHRDVAEFGILLDGAQVW